MKMEKIKIPVNDGAIDFAQLDFLLFCFSNYWDWKSLYRFLGPSDYSQSPAYMRKTSLSDTL